MEAILKLLWVAIVAIGCFTMIMAWCLGAYATVRRAFILDPVRARPWIKRQWLGLAWFFAAGLTVTLVTVIARRAGISN